MRRIALVLLVFGFFLAGLATVGRSPALTPRAEAAAPPPAGTARFTSARGAAATAIAPAYAPARAGNILLTHSTSQTVTLGNSIACTYNETGYHTVNSYYRVFDLVGEFGITDALDIDEVSFAIERATSGSGAQPLTVRIYLLNGPFILSNLTSLRSVSISLPDQSPGTIYSVPMSPPVTVPAGSVVVVEVLTPDGAAGGNNFFIGSNPAPETAPSYIRANACQMPQPTTPAEIGFPNMHIVLNASAGIAVATPTPTNTPPPHANANADPDGDVHPHEYTRSAHRHADPAHLRAIPARCAPQVGGIPTHLPVARGGRGG